MTLMKPWSVMKGVIDHVMVKTKFLPTALEVHFFLNYLKLRLDLNQHSPLDFHHRQNPGQHRLTKVQFLLLYYKQKASFLVKLYMIVLLKRSVVSFYQSDPHFLTWR